MSKWVNTSDFKPRKYTCGFCGALVGSNTGYYDRDHPDIKEIYICPNCERPTYFDGLLQYPAPLFGEEVKDLPEEIEKLYNEIRACTGARAYTACVLACRKLLMHIAVEKGASQGLSFKEYVEYLAEKHYTPPEGEEWVDHIRKKSNEANHEIVIMGIDDATNLITFVEMLLKFIYEFKGRLKPKL
ncbi:MAG: DUF4145 domain-containing protein [candidate division Zixibacteria bacterium]|nr:DUF4145 domain-containing protein [candidate division Zixibacteria bacterium]